MSDLSDKLGSAKAKTAAKNATKFLVLKDLPGIGEAGLKALNQNKVMNYWDLFAVFLQLRDKFSSWLDEVLPANTTKGNKDDLVMLLRIKKAEYENVWLKLFYCC